MEKQVLDQLKEEGILKESGALWFKGKLNAQPGTLYITKQRIAYIQNANQFAGPLLKLFVKSS